MSIFNLFKCKHKRTYEVTTNMDDGSFAVNTYCRKCEATVKVFTYGTYMFDGCPPMCDEVHSSSVQTSCTGFGPIVRKWTCGRCGKLNIEELPNPNAQERRRVERLRHQGNLLQYNHIVDINEKVRR